jgi:hypothetical protein
MGLGQDDLGIAYAPFFCYGRCQCFLNLVFYQFLAAKGNPKLTLFRYKKVICQLLHVVQFILSNTPAEIVTGFLKSRLLDKP